MQIQWTREEDSNVPVRPEGYKQVTEGKVLKPECETRCENIDRTCNPKESHLLWSVRTSTCSSKEGQEVSVPSFREI